MILFCMFRYLIITLKVNFNEYKKILRNLENHPNVRRFHSINQFLIIIILGVMATVFYYKYKSMSADETVWIDTTGQVTHIERSRPTYKQNDLGGHEIFYIRYQLANGTTMESVTTQSLTALFVGDTVNIVYNETQPNKIQFKNTNWIDKWLFTVLLLVFAPLFIGYVLKKIL